MRPCCDRVPIRHSNRPLTTGLQRRVLYNVYVTDTNPTDPDLDTLGRVYFAARDAMFALSTPQVRRAYREAARNYNDALDAAEQDGARNWSR